LLANILVTPGKIDLREIAEQEPSYGEVLIKIKSALTCGTDLKAFKRGHPVIPMPGVFGHEFSGIVARVGQGIRKFKEGDEIMAVHSAPCLECRYCRKRRYNLCANIMKTKVLGAFAEYILLPSHIVRQNVFLKPKQLSFEEAAFLEPLSCVVHGIESIRVKEKDTALIIGAGPIGLLHLLLLKKKGARVCVMDKHNKKLRMAKDLGADSIVMATRDNHNIKHARNFPGFDHVFECTGIPEVWEDSVNYVCKGGTVILFGGCKSGTKITYDAGRLHYDEITIKGTFHFSPSDVKKAYRLLCEGSIAVSRLISGRYPLSQTQKAFALLSKGIGIKYAIVP
jgi:L-iditol 2-dehydrogenase